MVRSAGRGLPPPLLFVGEENLELVLPGLSNPILSGVVASRVACGAWG